ncbi:pyridoxal-phosphate dependent enzyme [Reyranella sp. CPCC 100927]|uniref:threonine synthase n=1 Tax=Reyranella sp. CPCC 100927 TaxID=2599616 RepID=UPI0011B5DA97|nr:pyridoxal-phosphate dependent enzyme [Reyranella sp. CPCC 100927]TWT15572.1 pyridoxal-phosphate dependent enzyme [Reyranella sp. CPCC 100927]
MPQPSALACVRCGTRYPIDHYAQDCPNCRTAGAPSNLTVVYDSQPGAGLSRSDVPRRPASLWRWDAFLPARADDAVSLGEGNTPLLPAPSLGLGDVWVKDESRNPTWSFKDRLASGALTMARRFGATVITSSSSGNAGAAAAAYAAKAGLPCVVFTFAGASPPLVAQMRAYGAMVVVVEDKADRWRFQSAGVRELGWYPTSPFFGPVVGSNPYGMEGYKTIAFEIAEAFDWEVPDWCVLPVCYGDALLGMWKGFEELKALGWIARTPRFVAAEVSGSIATAMASDAAMPPDHPRNAPSIATSIGASQGTVQALEVVRRSRGAAVAIDDDALARWVVTLGAKEGLWPEPSSVAPFAAIERLRAQGVIASDARVVALMTAGGLKDPAVIDTALPAAPLVRGGFVDVLKALRDVYGFSHG